MIGHLYRYPHPHDPSRFIYVGQGLKRDVIHRNGREHFGKRFKKKFPNTDLPQPIRERVEVSDQLELNELETIWMFQYHTWRGYDGGMNLTFPGSADYKNLGRLAAAANTDRIKALGRENVDSGFLASIRNTERAIKARKENGYRMGERNKNFLNPYHSDKEHQRKAGRLGGKSAVDSGQIYEIQKLPQTQRAHRAVGKLAVDSGQLKRARESTQAKLARMKHGKHPDTIARLKQTSASGTHAWSHVIKAHPNPKCDLCSEQSLVVAYA
jgi:hypothetical protein